MTNENVTTATAETTTFEYVANMSLPIRANGRTTRLDIWPGKKKYAATVALFVPTKYEELLEALKGLEVFGEAEFKIYQTGHTFQFRVKNQDEADQAVEAIETVVLNVMNSLPEVVKPVKAKKVKVVEETVEVVSEEVVEETVEAVEVEA